MLLKYSQDSSDSFALEDETLPAQESVPDPFYSFQLHRRVWLLTLLIHHRRVH